MHYFTNINEIDKNKAALLIEASIQAYNAFDSGTPSECQRARVTPPTGYDFVECWTGVDSVFGGDRSVECYGVVFRTQTSPYTYIFAFRGTTSTLDMVDDLGVEKRAFAPLRSNAKVDSGVEVESGFFDVYSESTADCDSMQKQLFALIDKYNASPQPIGQLWITGHSLGSALSELFTLDLALSRPEVAALNYNFACPRVGNANFVAFYEQQAAQQHSETRTIRIQNTYDKVPCVPPEELGFAHTSYALLVAFYKDAPHLWDIDLDFIVHNHSAVNYRAVIDCAAASGVEGVCVGNVEGDGYKITSKRPDPSEICSFW